MQEQKKRIIPIAIEDEVKESYLNYAMSVIVSRALPDVRDGLKPVHRRILYAMNEMGLRHDKPYKKCGRIVGDVLGKYHPHGDQSIYDALVRLAQDFSLRMPVVQGQGNFGSIDGDPPAAMRYTEARLARVSEEILRDIDKNTVDFGPNYDDSMEEPLVLPTAFPFLVVNGASGIAVGMATNIPPHNLKEICDAISYLIDNPESDVDDLLQFVKGPDFPTAGVIHGTRGIRLAEKTGHGKVVIRAKYHIEELRGDKNAIIVTELPYMVNKVNLIIHIAELIKDKRIDGISDIRDESDRDGIRLVIELKKAFPAKVVLNNLFAHTALQTNFSVNTLALLNGRPRLFNLKELLVGFIDHRKEVITRRTQYDLNKAKEREHILQGLKIALDNIDEVIEIIKKSGSVNDARENLIKRFDFSEKQAQAILDMRLQRLTSLETQKIIEELEETKKFIAYCEDLLAHVEKIYQVIKDETRDLGERFGDPRRTVIEEGELDGFEMEDIIKKEDMAILLSDRGLIKRIPVNQYKSQGRGGKGVSTSVLKDEDFVSTFLIASTHSVILFITNKGKAYWLKAYEIPEGSKSTRGRHISTLFPFEEGETITETVELESFEEEKYVFMATKQGVVKKVPIQDFRNAKTRGIKAILLDDGDALVSTLLTDGNQDVVIISTQGKALRFSESEVRAMGRSSRGVRGLRLADDDSIIGVCLVEEGKDMLVVSEYGYAKRVKHDEFNNHARGTQGQRIYAIKDEKTGNLIAAIDVTESQDIICITSQGKALRVETKQIPIMGRNAFGVRTVNTSEDDQIIGLAAQEDEE
jgi:DNA gyrase subunit A